jgi:beta-N-acetylhexosaminidase
MRRLILIITICLMPTSSVLAVSQSDIDAAANDTNFYDPGYCGGSTDASTSTGSAVTSGSDNEQAIWNWLVGQGLSGAEAAGIMGNIEQESDFDPTIIQGGGDSNDPTAAGSGGWGLVQWTPGGKVLLDVSGAKATGSIDAIATQLQIMWWEAQGNGQWAGEGNTIAKVAAVTGNDDAAAEQVASIFVNDFEHAGIVGPRGADADSILALAKSKNWTNANATSSSGNFGPGGGTTTSSTTPTASSTTGATCCPSTATTNTLGTFASLTGDKAISGTFILGFDANTNKSDIEAVFKKYSPAGMYILNTTDAAAAGFNSTFYQALATDAGHPIITASDEEGLYTRYKYSFTFPSAGQMSTMSAAQVQAIGKQVGTAMAANGLNTDLAPVLDVGTGNNSDMHSQPGRTFGTNWMNVMGQAGAFADGLSTGGVKPVYKHFPGLGSSYGNTDTQSVTSPPLSQLEKSDLQPYAQLENQYGGAIMMDNAHVPGLTGGDVASTSAAAVSLLRNKYNFGGLVMSDDLIATGVGLPPDTALVKALQAGVDAPLEKYTSDAVLDSAIAKAKAAQVNTAAALKLLDGFVPQPPGATSGGTCTGAAAASGPFINPFPGGWIPNRLDMGYDGTFKGQIVAPFNGIIQFAGMTQGWNGSLMVVIKADTNPGLPTASLYFTEGVKPIVTSGQKVTAGTPIADPYPSPYGDAYATTPDGSGQIEWGVADSNAPQGSMPNTQAVIIGFPGTCSPSTASRAMVLAFYNFIKKAVPGAATQEQCAGAN